MIASPFKAEKAQLAAELDQLATLLDRPQKELDVAAIEGSLDALNSISKDCTQALHADRLSQFKAQQSQAQMLAQNHKHQVELSQVTLHIATLIKGVRAQIWGKRIPLTLPLEQDHPTHSETYLSDEIFLALHKFVCSRPQQNRGREQGQYADIPLRQSQFLNLISAAHRIALAQRREFPLRFLDVGCGSGLKVLSAANLFQKADGLEYDTGYAELARHLCHTKSPTGPRIMDGNALEFEGYDGYDVIYFYKPISDQDKMMTLEQRIVEFARPSTILITPYHDFTARSEDLGCARVADHIYITQSSAEQGEMLAQDATEIGLTPKSMFVRQPSDAMWRGVVDASLRNGFNPFREDEADLD